jgi:hypothetical protein
LGRFDPVIDRVPYQVSKRIFDGFNNGPVQFGFLALHLDAHFLAAGEREIADRAGKLAPDVADGLHSGPHDFPLQLAGNQVHALRENLKPRVLGAIGKLQQLVTGQYQPAHQIHQSVQQIDPYADRFRRRVRIPRLQRPLRGEDILRPDCTLLHQNLPNPFPTLFLLLQSPDKILGADLPALEKQAAHPCRVGQIFPELRPLCVRDRRRLWTCLWVCCALHRSRLRRRGYGARSLRGWRRRRLNGLRFLQAPETLDQRRIFVVAVLSGSPNRGEHMANRVYHCQQSACDLCRQRKLAIPQPREQALARVRQFFQPGKTQESAATLEGVDRPENAAQQLFRGRVGLQLNQFLVQAVQVFIALD